jgi:hypothetical protein
MYLFCFGIITFGHEVWFLRLLTPSSKSSTIHHQVPPQQTLHYTQSTTKSLGYTWGAKGWEGEGGKCKGGRGWWGGIGLIPLNVF